MPPIIAIIVDHDKATLHELDTVYGTQDMHDMMEIIAVSAANKRILNQNK